MRIEDSSCRLRLRLSSMMKMKKSSVHLNTVVWAAAVP